MNHATLKQVHVCPVETGLELIGGRWKARILWKLYNGNVRFGELRRGLPGITEKNARPATQKTGARPINRPHPIPRNAAAR